MLRNREPGLKCPVLPVVVSGACVGGATGLHLCVRVGIIVAADPVGYLDHRQAYGVLCLRHGKQVVALRTGGDMGGLS